MLLHAQYEFDPINDRIGQGGFATVYKGKDINLDIEVALKRFSKSESEKGSVVSEIRKCIRFNHPNIIRYYNCFKHSYTDHFGQSNEDEYGVMEYANSGHFGDIISRKIPVNEEEFKDIVIGILDGLQYLHTRDPVIIHRDLKPANILLSREGGKLVPKICDFGISKELSDENSTSTTTGIMGSIEYMAPEQLNMSKFGDAGSLQPNVDLWALGCMVYEYFIRKSPFGKRSEGIPVENIYINILMGEPLHGYASLPEPYREFSRKCFEKFAARRVNDVRKLKLVLTVQAKMQVQKRINKDDDIDNSSLGEEIIFFFLIMLILMILFVLYREAFSFP
jgi:serine/threonine protein kinase